MKLALWSLAALPASGLIFREGASPAANTETAPTGAYAGSGWQHQLHYRGFHGTIISPKHFITAVHIGTGSPLIMQREFFNGVEDRPFTVKRGSRISGTDFRIFEIWETFDDYALLYTDSDEIGKEVVVHGGGLGAGAELAGRGWGWGGGATQKSRWGRNDLEGAFDTGSNKLIHFDFSDVFGQDEVMVANRDSGGGWFIKDGNLWKLAGVTYSVTNGYSTAVTPSDATRFSGPLYNADNAWIGNDDEGWVQVPPFGSSNDPEDIRFYRQTNGYASRVSVSAGAIQAVIDPAIDWSDLSPSERLEDWLGDFGITVQVAPADDADADGLTNLEEYLAESDPSVSGERVSPMEVEYLSDGSHRFTLIESLDLEARGLTSFVQVSSNLIDWDPVNDLTETANVRSALTGVRTRTLTRTPADSDAIYYRLCIVLASP